MNLEVSFGGALVGMLTDHDGRFSFAYDDDWLRSPNAFPVSVQMPLAQKEWPQEIAHNFFANLLPEGPARQMYCDRLGVAYDDDIRLLEALGGDTAGALTIGQADAVHSRLLLSAQELERFSAGHATFREDEVVRLSLAGAQHKVSAILGEAEYWWPGSQDASTHILKFDSTRFPHLSVNEFFMRSLAEQLDLPVVAAELDTRGSRPFLVVERYDRRLSSDGHVERLHQEDFCQVLGLSHRQKYENSGGPTLERIATAIREHSTQPALDIQSLLRWVMFNVLAGNADGHAKNISFLRTESGLSLAPFYDLVCTRVYPNVDRLMAFSMAGSRDSDTYSVQNWKGLAVALKLRPRVVQAELTRMFNEHEDAIRFSKAQTLAAADLSVVDPIIQAVSKRFRGVANVLLSTHW